MSHDSDKLHAAIAEYVQLMETGRRPDPQNFLDRHADVRVGLESFLVDYDRMQAVVDVPPQLDKDRDRRASASLQNTGLNDENTPPAPRHVGDYELLELIAHGGMGVVYKARQRSLDRIVAVKMILAGQLASGEEVQRFFREARAAGRLDHPSIVPVFEVGSCNGQHFFSMGYVEGGSLADEIREGPIDPQRAARHALTIAEAVDYAHARGVIHRDIKPGNVLIDASGNLRITDFGLAARTEETDGATVTGQILGTPAWMPPEQASGLIENVGPLSDVYSIGAVLYCLLTGRPPFQAAHPVETLRQVIQQEPVPPRQINSAIPPDLETICLKCLEKEPSRRYASARDLAEDLGRFLNQQPILARPIRRSAGTPKRTGRHRVVSALMAATALMLVVVVSAATVYIQNGRGALMVKVDDPSIEVRVVGEEFRITPDNDGSELRIAAGPRQVEVHHGDLAFLTPVFDLRRNDRVILNVRLVDGAITVHNGDTILFSTDVPGAGRDVNRAAVAAILEAGGSVQLSGASGTKVPINAIEELPEGDWTLDVHVPASGTVTPEALSRLGDADRIASLEITAPLGGSILSELPVPPRLTTLCLNELTEFTADDLRSWSASPTLTSLRLGGVHCPSLNDDVALVVSGMSQLHELAFVGHPGMLTDRGLSYLKRLTRLEQFSFVSSNITDAGLAGFLAAMPQLTQLHVQAHSESVRGAFLETLSTLPNLEVLNVFCDHLDDQYLSLVPQAANLRELHLAHCTSITGSTLDSPGLPLSLESLTFHQTALGDEGLREIAHVQQLEKLSIRDNPSITDDGLVSLRNLPNLYRLDMSDNPQLSDAALDVCAELRSLTRLYVGGTGVTPEGIERLKTARPDLRIVATPKGSE